MKKSISFNYLRAACSHTGSCREQTPLLRAATQGVVGSRPLCSIPTWVERAKNNAVVKKTKLTSGKVQF